MLTRRVWWCRSGSCAALLIAGGCGAPSTTSRIEPVPPAVEEHDTLVLGARLDLDDPVLTPAAGPIRRCTRTHAGSDFDPDVDANGRTLAFASTRGGPRPDIYLQELPEGEPALLAPDPADDVQPAFSPDGRRIAFCSNRAGTWDLWLVERDGSNLHRLTTDLGEEIAPAWSPDGTRLAFASWTPARRKWEVWVLAVDSREPRRVVANGLFPAWSPDGRRIAMQRQSQPGARRFGIWLVEFDGLRATGEVELSPRGTESYVAPCWSPDGGKVACVAAPRSGPRTKLVVLDAAERQLESLYESPVTAMSPRWARDGTIYFVQSAAGRESIWAIAAPAGPVAGAKEDSAASERVFGN